MDDLELVLTTVTALGAIGAVVIASTALITTYRQNLALTGALVASAWRDQVIDLYDRGLSVQQIWDLFCTEDGMNRETGGLNGPVEDIVAVLEDAGGRKPERLNLAR